MGAHRLETPDALPSPARVSAGKQWETPSEVSLQKISSTHVFHTHQVRHKSERERERTRQKGRRARVLELLGVNCA